MLTAVLTVLLFVLLIFPHELGHFTAAKLLGVQVNEFSLGMGPALYSKQKGETQYSIRLFPIGGYCAMEGEDETSDNPRAFTNANGWKKFIILFSGAGMNILIALALMIIVVCVSGMATTTIGSVTEGAPAYEAGISAGDVIISIDGTDVESWTDVTTLISAAEEGESVEITCERDGEEYTVSVTPEYSEEEGRSLIGIETKVVHFSLSTITYGAKLLWQVNKLMIQSLITVFTGGASIDDVSGPVGIVSLVNDAAESSYTVINFIYLAAIISLNLAIINLLPFPALDGGRILFLVIRAIGGDSITNEMEGIVHMIGMVMIILLVLVVTWKDIMALF